MKTYLIQAPGKIHSRLCKTNACILAKNLRLEGHFPITIIEITHLKRQFRLKTICRFFSDRIENDFNPPEIHFFRLEMDLKKLGELFPQKTET